MAKIILELNGVAYPCRLTMGALLRFKEETGHEISECNDSIKDMCAFIWACVASSAHREGKEFDMDFLTFCDNVEPDDLMACWQKLQAENAVGSADIVDTSEKKSK